MERPYQVDAGDKPGCGHALSVLPAKGKVFVVSIEDSIKNAKYAEWIEEYQWDTCKMGRRYHGEFLANYLISKRDGLVLNLNGSWGTGKTDFMRRLYVHFLQRYHPVIYIDAWESDFSKEPLMVIAGELLQQLQALNENIGNLDSYEIVASKFAGFLKGAVIFGGSALTKGVFGDAEMGKIIAENMMGNKADQGMLALSKLHGEQVDAIKSIREELSNLAEALRGNYGYKLPVIVLIDELDRCRPDYSIEMLEVVKHFFQASNLVFVVASDTDQLCKSIAVVYGESFSAASYLRRFFNRTARLPKPSFSQFVKGAFDELAAGVPWVVHDTVSLDAGFEVVFSALCDIHHKILELRDVDQIIERIKSNYAQASEFGRASSEEQHINFTFMCLLSIRSHMDTSFYPQQGMGYGGDPDVMLLDVVHISSFIAFCSGMVWGVKQVDHHVVSEYIAHELYNTRSGQVDSQLFRDAVGRLQSYLSKIKIEHDAKHGVYKVPNAKWWLVDDYVKVVNLSGSLE